jgi:hypothetical protein
MFTPDGWLNRILRQMNQYRLNNILEVLTGNDLSIYKLFVGVRHRIKSISR